MAISQEQLNQVMMMHRHKNKIDAMYIFIVAHDFI